MPSRLSCRHNRPRLRGSQLLNVWCHMSLSSLESPYKKMYLPRCLLYFAVPRRTPQLYSWIWRLGWGTWLVSERQVNRVECGDVEEKGQSVKSHCPCHYHMHLGYTPCHQPAGPWLCLWGLYLSAVCQSIILFPKGAETASQGNRNPCATTDAGSCSFQQCR